MADKLNDELVGVVAYANHRGVHQTIVTRMIESKRIPFVMKNGRRMVNIKEADKAWPIEKPSQQQDEFVPDISKQEAFIKAYKARLAKLEYEEKSGKLINRELVRNQIVGSMRAIRDAIIGIPQKIAAEVASETDPYACESIMMKEINTVLTELSTLADRYR